MNPRSLKVASTLVMLGSAIGFLIVLAGGPGQFMLAVEHLLETIAAGLYSVYQSAKA